VKLVTRASTALKRCPGRMNNRVAPSYGETSSGPEGLPAAVSRVRTLVVPTAMIRPACWRVRLINSAALGLSWHHSEWMACSSGVSSVTGAKVSRPTCRVRDAWLMPASDNSAKRRGVKCSPAVGQLQSQDWRHTRSGIALDPAGVREYMAARVRARRLPGKLPQALQNVATGGASQFAHHLRLRPSLNLDPHTLA
jgi:hypothetical protein